MYGRGGRGLFVFLIIVFCCSSCCWVLVVVWGGGGGAGVGYISLLAESLDFKLVRDVTGPFVFL